MNEAQKAQANVKRDARDADCGEELQHRRREKGDAQHAQCSAAQILADGDNGLGLGLGPAEEFQRHHAAQTVAEAPRQPLHSRSLLRARCFGAPTDQRHEDRDEWRRDEEQRSGHPIDRHQHKGEGQEARLDHRGEVAGEITVEPFDVVDERRGERPARAIRH